MEEDLEYCYAHAVHVDLCGVEGSLKGQSSDELDALPIITERDLLALDTQESDNNTIQEQKYFKVFEGSKMYNTIMNYMRNRNNAAVDYMNNNFSHLLATDIKTYKTELAKFYENYPSMFNEDVCYEEN